MNKLPTIQLADFCRLFGVEDRQARYVLEQGFVPHGVETNPSTGNRREFGPGHAFWLAIILRLKQMGMRTALAAEVADRANRFLREVPQNLSRDWTFLPALGHFDTDHQYFLEVADIAYVRLVTDAHPSGDGLFECDWIPLRGRPLAIKDFQPCVVLRVNLTKIAGTLSQVAIWSKTPNDSRTRPQQVPTGTRPSAQTLQRPKRAARASSI